MSDDAYAAIFFFVCAAVLFLIALASTLWAYKDAEDRGKSGCLWSLLIIFTWPIGLIAYFVLRDRNVQL